MKKINYLVGLVLTSSLLSACGGGGDGNSQSFVKPNDENLLESTEGRLLVINEDTNRPELSLYDLNQSKTIDRVALSSVPTGVYASPAFRYGVLLDRNNHYVHFYDSGLSAKNDKILSTKPQLLNYQLFGASPTHYRNFNGQAAIFYDGNETASSKFDVFTESGIGSKNIASQSLPYKHHGVAEPLGEYVLSSYLDQDQTKLSIVKSYGQHGDHYHEEQTLTNRCSGLHGASSVKGYSAFGCEDGVLLVEHHSNQFKDYKLPVDVRIGTVVGQANANELVGLASTTPDLFIINGENRRVQQITWTEKDSDVKRLKQVYSQSGNYFVVLDSLGQLVVFDAKTWVVKQRIQVIDRGSEAVSKANLVANGQQDRVFVNDVLTKKIYEIDLVTAKLVRTIQLDVVPQQFVWLGAAK